MKRKFFTIIALVIICAQANGEVIKQLICERTTTDVFMGELGLDLDETQYDSGFIGDHLKFRKTMVDGEEKYALDENTLGVVKEFYDLNQQSDRLVFTANTYYTAFERMTILLDNDTQTGTMYRDVVCGAYPGPNGCSDILLDVFTCKIN